MPAGEHACKEHPDTAGGAMLTGMQEVIPFVPQAEGEASKLKRPICDDLS